MADTGLQAKDVLNLCLSALSNGLYALFPEISVFVEEVPDDLPDRCFLTGFAGSARIAHDFDIRYKVSGTFDIAYYSPKHSTALQEELNQVFSTLSLGMKIIQAEGIILRLGTHEKTTTDGVLHDLCKFSTFLYVIDGTPLITSIDYEQEVL